MLMGRDIRERAQLSHDFAISWQEGGQHWQAANELQFVPQSCEIIIRWAPRLENAEAFAFDALLWDL